MKGKENNKRFTELVDKLKKIKGVTYKSIEDKLGIDKNKRRSIKNYTTTIEEDLINKLFEEFPEAYEIEGQDVEKPISQKRQIEELKERLKALEDSRDKQANKLIQLEYIVNSMIKDVRLIGKVWEILEEAKKDPTISDAFDEWPGLLAKFQSGIGSEESDKDAPD